MKLAAIFVALALAGCAVGPQTRASLDLDVQQRTALARALAAGTITQAQYDQRSSDLQDGFDEASSEADQAPKLGTPGEQWEANHRFEEGMAQMRGVTGSSQP